MADCGRRSCRRAGGSGSPVPGRPRPRRVACGWAYAGRADREVCVGRPRWGQKTLNGRNCTEIRGPARRDLGHGVLPGALAGATHHDQVAVAHLDGDRVAAPARSQGQAPGVAHRDDGDHGVVGAAPADGVAVPGHASRARRGSSSSPRCGTARRARARSARDSASRAVSRRGVGERLADHVGVQQPWHVDDPVVHLAPLGAPRHVGHERSRRPRRPRAASPRATSTQAPRVELRRSSDRRGPGSGRRRSTNRLLWKSMARTYAASRTDVRQSTARVVRRSAPAGLATSFSTVSSARGPSFGLTTRGATSRTTPWNAKSAR